VTVEIYVLPLESQTLGNPKPSSSSEKRQRPFGFLQTHHQREGLFRLKDQGFVIGGGFAANETHRVDFV
jgi:hypothetical protein